MNRYRISSMVLISFYFLIIEMCSFSLPAALAQPKGKESPHYGGVYRRPLDYNPKSLDPARSIDINSVAVIQQVFDGLVQFDKNLNVIPAIAKTWIISSDGLTYTFVLRKGVTFHNGREVTANDFVYSFTRLLDPGIRSTSSDFFGKILGADAFRSKKAEEVKGITAEDTHTLRIVLSEPYAPFLSIIAMKGAKVVPKEEVEKLGVEFAKSPTGTGPFRFTSMHEGEEITLESNHDYFEGRPYLNKIVFKIFEGSLRGNMFKEFKTGALDESFVPPDEMENVAREAHFLFVQKPILSLRFYGFNLRSKPLNNQKLRKAINCGIDKVEIVSKIHKNQLNLAKGILPAGMPGYEPTRIVYPFDETRALKLLSEAGEKQPTLDIWSASKSETAERELNEIKAQLSKLGIQANVNFETNWQKFTSMLSEHRPPVFIYAWYADFPDPDNFLGTLFHSRSQYNYTGYSNPRVDGLLDQARGERDYLKRMQMYRDIEDLIMEDAPILPMVNNLFQMVYQPYVKGLEVNALGAPYIPMRKIWLTKE